MERQQRNLVDEMDILVSRTQDIIAQNKRIAINQDELM
jgi:hypothetical protein